MTTPYRSPGERPEGDGPTVPAHPTRRSLAVRMLGCVALVWVGLLGCGVTSDVKARHATWSGTFAAVEILFGSLVPVGAVLAIHVGVTESERKGR